MHSAGDSISKLCRICRDQNSNDLISLLTAENQLIVKKICACADVTVSATDLKRNKKKKQLCRMFAVM